MFFWQTSETLWGWLPKLQGHRGFWIDGQPQNSLMAIQKSFELGYEICEFDVSMTKDGHLILFHDQTCGGRNISEMNLVEIQANVEISLLSEIMYWFSRVENLKLNIEIKSRDIFNRDLEFKLVEMVQEFQVIDRVIVSSFNPFALFRVRRSNSKIYRALLLTKEISEENHWLLRSCVLNILARPHALHLRSLDFNRNFRKLSKKIPIVLWTVNELDFYKRNQKQIHGIISDSIRPRDFEN